MKPFPLKLLTLPIIGLIMGCDPRWEVDYEVWNNSGESLSIYVDYPWASTDTSIIANGTKLIFLNDFGLGKTTHRYLDELEETLPFEIFIFNESGSPYNKNAEEISRWSKFYPKKDQAIGLVQLRVRAEDFD